LISLAEFKDIPRPKDKREPLRAKPHDVIDMFRDALAGQGFRPQEIVPDGIIHRFAVGKKSNLDGYYSLTLTDYGGRGIYGNWQVDDKEHHWTSYSETELSPTQLSETRRQRAIEKKTIQEENKRRFESGVIKAKKHLLSFRKADMDHQYIIKKQIGIFEDIQRDSDDLIIPVYSVEGKIQTYQRIPADGKKKRYMAGGTAKGGFYPMQGDASTVCICEGYATGWSIHQATGHHVICAFNAGGLKTVAKLIRQEYPDADIKICADNDHGKPQNTGIKAGLDAAREVNGVMVCPKTEDNITDFNDLHVAHGIDAVVNQIEKRDSTKINSFGWFAIGDFITDIKATDWKIKGVLEDKVLAVLFGQPGSLKSFVALSLANSIATGTKWFGHEVKQGPVFYIVGEGINGIKKRCAAWSIGNKVDLKGAPLYMSTSPMQALNQDSAKEVAMVIDEIAAIHGKPASIFIDTLARNFGPGDENSTADMSKFVATIDSVMGNDCLRLIVHHTGHGNQQRARGNSSLVAAVDAEYRLVKNENKTVTMSNTKLKDEPEWSEDMVFSSRQVVVCDKYEDDVTSIVLESQGWKKVVNTSKMSLQQKSVLEVLKWVNNESKDKLWHTDGLPRNLVVTQLVERGVCDTAHAGRVLKRLEKRGFIKLSEDKIIVFHLGN
jgi:phage/plasmid primase-like uncharacterized protein